MTFLLILVGAILFVVGALVSYFSGIRALQTSRRLADYRVRRRYVVRARWSLAGGLLSVAVAIGLMVTHPLPARPAVPTSIKPGPSFIATALAAASPSPTATASPAISPTPAGSTPTHFVITPSPASTSTAAATNTPSLPIAVEAMVQGSMTPVFPIQIGRVRISTDINNYQLIAPADSFRNPIKHVYAVFSVQPQGTKVQWTALWFHDGGLKYIDTNSWRNSPAGIGVADWGQDTQAWLPGTYEVQIFVGTGWKGSGSFTLLGDPPTITPTQTAGPSPLPPTAAPSSTPTRTAAPSSTPIPVTTQPALPTATLTVAPSPLPSATMTRTPLPTATLVPTLTVSPASHPAGAIAATPSRTATATPTRTAQPSATPSRTPSPSPSPTSTFTATLRPTNTATRTPTRTPTATASSTATRTLTPTPLPPTRTPTATSAPVPLAIKVFFTNTQQVDKRVPPFDESVIRQIPPATNPIAAALDAYFTGPNAQEQGHGLVATWNGFVGYRRIDFANGTLNIYLAGNCRPTGNGYSLDQPLTETMKQFPGVTYVKIYDEYEHTRDPIGNADSGPVCLDVIFTNTPTLTPTPTNTFTPTPTAIPTNTPTRTPVPTATLRPTSTATNTPLPTATPTRTPLPTATRTPVPTATLTPTSTPTNTPLPTATATRTPLPTPTRTPVPTATLRPTSTPTNTPRPTATPTRTPLPTATRTPVPTATLRPTNTPTNTPRPTATPTRTPLPTATRVPSNTPTRTPQPSATPTRTPLPSPTATRTALPSSTPTKTPLPTATRTAPPTATRTLVPVAPVIPTKTATRVPPPTATVAPTSTPRPTATPRPSNTPTRTPVPTATLVPSPTPTRTPLPTATVTPTSTPRPTATPAPSNTPTRTPVPTATLVPSATPSRTPLPTATAVPSNTPTRTPLPTATLLPSFTPTRTPTRTPPPSATPRPSNTPTTAPTSTATSTPSITPTWTPSPTATIDTRCNRAAFVGDVTIPDHTKLHLAQPFIKTWRIRNTGTCIWTTAYKLVFVGGDQMGSPASVPLPINVAPQQTVDLSVNMMAPVAVGHYEGLWQLQTADGKRFGVGDAAKDNMWVRISAVAPAYSTPTATAETPTSTLTAVPGTPTVTMTAVASATSTAEGTAEPQVPYTFASNPCEAQWQSNTGVLACPGKEGDAGGFVLRLNQAQLEDGTTAPLPSLLTFPHDSTDGYILGVYPEYQVQQGDHFQASVGCEKDATACSVLFRLSYLDASSTPHDLWTLGEFYDGKYFNLDLDLSQLAGQKVKFVLDVSSLGDSHGDRALWVDPHIVRFAVPTATVTDTPTAALPTTTPTLVPTPTAPATLTPTALAVPTATPPASTQPSPIQQVFDSIISFFQQLIRGR